MLSVVIPAFNEEKRLPPSLRKASAWLRKRKIAHEIIVVDDGSSDATAAVCEAMKKKVRGLRVLRQDQNRGKGAAVKRGVEGAKGTHVLFMDADLSTPIEEYEKLSRALRGGAFAVAIGSRAMDRGLIKVRQPFYREAAGRFFNRLARAFTLPGISDTQCGFKLFEASAAKRIFALQQVPRFGFDVEALFLARKLGYRIAECQVRWENSPETKVRPIADGARTFLDLGLIRWYDVTGKYGR